MVQPKQEYGVGKTNFSTQAYALCVRMLAENWRRGKVLEEIHRRFPEHRLDGEQPVTVDAVKNVIKRRQAEIQQLREELNAEVGDMWIANRRSQLAALQRIFEDQNRYTPKRILEGTLTKIEALAGKSPKRIVVYEKDTGGMLATLRLAREVTGADAGTRVANTLEDLVKRAEKERGLEISEPIDVTPEGAVPMLQDAKLIDVPDVYPSRGDDQRLGLLDGSTEPGESSALGNAVLDDE
jgi:hypothetical protein